MQFFQLRICVSGALLLFYLIGWPTHESQARRGHIDINFYICWHIVCVHPTGLSQIPSFNLSDNHKRMERNDKQTLLGFGWLCIGFTSITADSQSTMLSIGLRSYDRMCYPTLAAKKQFSSVAQSVNNGCRWHANVHFGD